MNKEKILYKGTEFTVKYFEKEELFWLETNSELVLSTKYIVEISLYLLKEAKLAFSEVDRKPKPLLEPARNAFLASYTAEKKKNSFTKVQMDYEADQVLQTYFQDNAERIESWFNIITPRNGTIQGLHSQISQLRDKNWETIHSL